MVGISLVRDRYEHCQELIKGKQDSWYPISAHRIFYFCRRELHRCVFRQYIRKQNSWVAFAHVTTCFSNPCSLKSICPLCAAASQSVKLMPAAPVANSFNQAIEMSDTIRKASKAYLPHVVAPSSLGTKIGVLTNEMPEYLSQNISAIYMVVPARTTTETLRLASESTTTNHEDISMESRVANCYKQFCWC